MNRTILKRFAMALCFICAFVGEAAAQTVTGSLVGNVTDANANAVAGARVRITEISRGTTRETTTSGEGNYTFSSLEPGIYRVEVEQQGFGKFVREQVEVPINTTPRVDAQLAIGDVTETVEITAASLLKTDRADLSTQLGQVQVENLPLTPDRNYQGLLELVPGATEPAPTGSSLGNPQGTLQYNVNGQNIRANSDQVDGTINNQTNTQARTVIVPPAEAIQVVDVSTNAYDAEFGRATGAIVNVQLKSGTNKFRGSAFVYNVDDALKARNTLSTLEKPNTSLTQFGFTLGGPIRRNHTFFFGDYQRNRNRVGQNVLASVPTEAFRRGDFTAASTAIFDPLTGTSTGANRTQFRFNGVNNVIDPARISPVARAILSGLPLPNLPGLTDNYEASGTLTVDSDAFDVKINHRFGDRTEGFASYSFFNARTSDPPIFDVLGGPNSDGDGTAAIGRATNQRATFNLIHTFSPSFVTEFRLGALRSLTIAEAPTEADLATQFGIPGINNGDVLTAGIPRIRTSGFTFLGINSGVPFKIPETAFNFVNNYTKVKGNHTIRFGADIRNVIANIRQVGATRGDFVFTNSVTGRSNPLPGQTSAPSTSSANAFASFLLGLPQQILRDTERQPGGYRVRQYFFFAQDRWQINPKLTFNYGLRYEIQPFAIVPKPGDQSLYDPETNRIFVAGFGGNDLRANVKTDYTNFAPRLGVAYRLNDKTVIRSGYGISYAPFFFRNTGGFPSEIGIQLQGANSFQPAGNIANGIPPAPVLDFSSGVVSSPLANTIRLTATDLNPRRGYTQSYNLAVQRDFLGFVGEVAYVGSVSTRLPAQRNINSAPPGATNTQRPLALRFGRTADTTFFGYFLSASYNALQAKLERRFRQGSNLTVSYTFSKSLDYANDLSVANNLDIDSNRGVSGFDRPHNLVVSHVIRLPFFRNRPAFDEGGLTLAGILGGFQLAGVFSARSGTPVDITTAATGTAAPGNTNRPNRIADPRILGGTGRGQLFFDTSVFVNPEPGTFGNAGRNTVRGPNYFNYNLSLFRNFDLTETTRLQFRAEAFNVTNTPHFRNPSGNFSAGTFGQITTSFGGRQIRLGARLTF